MKTVLTAILNPKINKELNKKEDLEVLEKDILYQEALLEIIKNKKIVDFLILNSDLPGEEEIDIIIKKIIEENPKIKIILFTDQNKKISYKIYKKYLKEEMNTDLIYKLIKNEKVEKSKINENKNKKIISIIGANGVGKSVFSANIGLCFSKNKKRTIILDCNRFCRTNEVIFKLKIITKPYREIKDNYKKINNNLYYMNIYYFLKDNKKMNEIFENLKKEFEIILIDFSNILKQVNILITKTDINLILVEGNISEINKTENILKYINKKIKKKIIILL